MSSLYRSSKSSDSVCGRQERPSAAICIVPLTCLTLKSNSHIYAIYQVTSALGKSIAARLS
jgi:hypothetical protein